MNYAEIVEAGEAIKNHSEFKTHYNGVCDFRSCQKDISYDEMRDYSKRIARKTVEKTRWCSINSTPKETGLAYLLKDCILDIHPMEVFTSVKAASEYLGMNLDKYLSPD